MNLTHLTHRAVIAALALCSMAAAQTTQPDTRPKVALSSDPYPLDTCPVSGLKLGEMGPPITMIHAGREVRFCSAGCIGRFEADPAGYLKKIDEQIIEQQVAHYPLTICPISGEPLDAMGGAVNYVHNNRLVRFCAVYLATLNEAWSASGGGTSHDEQGGHDHDYGHNHDHDH